MLNADDTSKLRARVKTALPNQHYVLMFIDASDGISGFLHNFQDANELQKFARFSLEQEVTRRDTGRFHSS